MPNILDSVRKLFFSVVFIVVLALITVGLFDLIVIGPTNLPAIVAQIGDLIILFSFSAVAFYFLRKIKDILTPRTGLQVATVIQFFVLALASIVVIFALFDIFGVPFSTLLTSAGIISITVGLIISTFVGGILSGALVFTTHKLKIGEDVLINNIPGKVSDMTALVTRIRTDVGQITIPNNAIASGGVIVTTVLPKPANQESRLPYVVGDRVITSFRNEEGTVKEVTSFHTTVQLDSGKQITFLNNTVLSGAIAIAKITGS
ncbi:MAG: mechanosensitive ion channel domain-containing protein [Candidatus Bathyarchaeia archaeon]|jgi:small-conductance mechanosensitive channel